MHRFLPLLLFTACALGSGVVLAQRTPSDARSGPDPRLREILVAAIEDASSFDDQISRGGLAHRHVTPPLPPSAEHGAERIEILTTVHQQATRAGVEPELVLAVIDVESNFDRFAISPRARSA